LRMPFWLPAQLIVLLLLLLPAPECMLAVVGVVAMLELPPKSNLGDSLLPMLSWSAGRYAWWTGTGPGLCEEVSERSGRAEVTSAPGVRLGTSLTSLGDGSGEGIGEALEEYEENMVPVLSGRPFFARWASAGCCGGDNGGLVGNSCSAGGRAEGIGELY
jgi:hypothetical protein